MQWELSYSMQTDRQTDRQTDMMSLNVTVSKFANMPSNFILYAKTNYNINNTVVPTLNIHHQKWY